MLRLGEEVRGGVRGIGLRVGDDQDLAGAGDHIDGRDPEDLAFGFRDEGIPRTHDLVGFRDAFGAVGQSRHRLRPADLEDAVDPGDPRRGQNDGIHLSVPTRRRGDHELLYAGDLGRDGIHQHCGRIRGGPPGHIDAHALQRQDLLAHDNALPIVQDEAAPTLLIVERPDRRCRFFQHGLHPGVHQGYGFIEFLF